MRLPHSLADLPGLRVARWIRESTRGQYDTFGPDAQRDQQDRAIERHELVDTGITWSVAHSGRTVAGTPQFREMLAAAGATFDVLVVGYVSRFARDLRTAVNARHDLHQAGAAILFADERLLSSDEDAWEQWAREAVEAEAYSRRLGRRIREGYEAKFRRLADQGGNAPLGFRRAGDRHLLEVDPDTIGQAVEAFRRYSTGLVGIRPLAAQLGMDPDALRALLANPVYNGFVRRGKRRQDEQLVAAAWRADPPVSDELWRRVRDIAARHYHGGGHPTPRHAHLLAGLLRCDLCGQRIRAEAHDGRRRYRHPGDRCPAWATSTVTADRFDAVINAQVNQARFSREQLVALARLGADPAPAPVDEIGRRRIEHELEQHARSHARGRLSTDDYLAIHARLSADLAELAPAEQAVNAVGARGYLSDLKAAWRFADLPTKHRIAVGLYDRVVVDSSGVRHVALTPQAEHAAMALALPQTVRLPMLGARPAGPKPSRTHCRLEVIGRREWLDRLRRTA